MLFLGETQKKHPGDLPPTVPTVPNLPHPPFVSLADCDMRLLSHSISVYNSFSGFAYGSIEW